MDNKTKGILESGFPLPPFISEWRRKGVHLGLDKINERAAQLFLAFFHNLEMGGKGVAGCGSLLPFRFFVHLLSGA